MMGGPLPHVVAAKAVALREAQGRDFKEYSRRTVENARALADACMAAGLDVVTGGTDNHLLLVNVASIGLTGRQAESALHSCGITLNRNSLPFDPNGPWYTSGLRLGTPAVTTLGMGPDEMGDIAAVIQRVLASSKPGTNPDGTVSKARCVVDPRTRAEARNRSRLCLTNSLYTPSSICSL